MSRSVISEGFQDVEEPMSQINVTSLVDVMFCLLIMFMAAAPLLSPDAVPIDLPHARGKPITEEEFLYSVVSVDGKGQVFLGALPLSHDPTKMASELGANVKLKADGMAFVQGDENAAFSRIVDVLAALKQAEVSKIGFVTDPRVERRKDDAP